MWLFCKTTSIFLKSSQNLSLQIFNICVIYFKRFMLLKQVFHMGNHMQKLYTMIRSSHQRCPIKKLFLKVSQNSQKNTCARISFLINRIKFRSSHQRCSLKKGVLRNFTKFTGKQLCQGLFFNKVAGLTRKLFWRVSSNFPRH